MAEVENEKIKRMVEFRSLLEKRKQEVETELEGLRILLEFTNAELLKKGFRRAEIVKPAPPQIVPQHITEYERVIPLKTVTGDLLANLHVSGDSMRVVPAEDKDFNINTPPFTVFLVEKVLAKMRERDLEAARVGEINPEKIFSYHISRDGDIFREITIQNISPERSRELKSTIRWTLEKMYEKTMKTGV